MAQGHAQCHCPDTTGLRLHPQSANVVKSKSKGVIGARTPACQEGTYASSPAKIGGPVQVISYSPLYED